MAYTRVNWENSPSTKTPVNATNLNTMDAGIKANSDAIDTMRSNLGVFIKELSFQVTDVSSVTVKFSGQIQTRRVSLLLLSADQGTSINIIPISFSGNGFISDVNTSKALIPDSFAKHFDCDTAGQLIIKSTLVPGKWGFYRFIILDTNLNLIKV